MVEGAFEQYTSLGTKGTEAVREEKKRVGGPSEEK